MPVDCQTPLLIRSRVRRWKLSQRRGLLNGYVVPAADLLWAAANTTRPPAQAGRVSSPSPPSAVSGSSPSHPAMSEIQTRCLIFSGGFLSQPNRPCRGMSQQPVPGIGFSAAPIYEYENQQTHPSRQCLQDDGWEHMARPWQGHSRDARHAATKAGPQVRELQPPLCRATAKAIPRRHPVPTT
jgi:hypothetical protein